VSASEADGFARRRKIPRKAQETMHDTWPHVDSVTNARRR
jgi:hypothetical protein